MVDTDIELYKIRVAFDRVKSDILHLYEKVRRLEEQNNQLKKELAKYEVTSSKTTQTSNNEEKLYIGHKNTKKIHASDCPYAKNIASENRIIFSNLNDALKKHYVTCSCLGQ